MSPSPNSSLVEIQGLTKSYGSFEAVKDLNLTVSYGQIFALLGPNGAGKTTTIRMLMGILAPSAGSAKIDGLDCFQDRVEVKRRVGYLPDEPIFHDHLRGSEIIRFSGEMHGLQREEIETRTRALLQQLELTDALEEFAVNYSRGMKKKLALVCAMLHDPALLILDEPTNFLDLLGIIWLQRFLLQLRETGPNPPTVVLVSHDRDFINTVCQELVILRNHELTYFRGDLNTYDSSIRDKKLYLSRMRDAQEKQKAHMQQTIAQNIKQGKAAGDENKLRQAKSRQKKLDNRMGISVTEMARHMP